MVPRQRQTRPLLGPWKSTHVESPVPKAEVARLADHCDAVPTRHRGLPYCAPRAPLRKAFELCAESLHLLFLLARGFYLGYDQGLSQRARQQTGLYVQDLTRPFRRLRDPEGPLPGIVEDV